MMISHWLDKPIDTGNLGSAWGCGIYPVPGAQKRMILAN
jgi:hypothetical protein